MSEQPEKTLHQLLEAELYARLTQDKCDQCGRLGASTQELELIRKYLNTNGSIRDPFPNYKPGEAKGPKAMPHGSPFPDDEDGPIAAQEVL